MFCLSGNGRRTIWSRTCYREPMLSRTKVAVAAAGLALSLGIGTGIASAEPDASTIVNSTCTYPQVMEALNDQNPGAASQLNANPIAVGWLQGLVAAPPDQRRVMIQQVQGIPV